MATPDPAPVRTFGDRLLSIPRTWLFLVLFAATTIPHFMAVEVPNKPNDSAVDLYRELMALPEGSTVIVQSDWTNSTRGESRGQFDALMRILMRRNIKFGVLAVADTQAPEVARNVIDDVNRERKARGEREYRVWEDWVNLGYFPNAEGLGNQLAQNLRDTIKARREKDPTGMERSVVESPVFANVPKVENLSAFIVVTGTKSITIAIERLQSRVKMLGMVTGVMGPETLNYYVSKQLKGLSAGLKGVYDMETLMENGIKSNDGSIEVPGWEGHKNLDRGTRYILTLHAAILLLIVAVVLGNIGVVLNRRKPSA